MSVFSRLFAKAEDSAEPEIKESGDAEFRRKFADFARSRKGSEKLIAALERWEKENGRGDDPDFITEEEKKRILNDLIPRPLVGSSFRVKDEKESAGGGIFPADSRAIAMDANGAVNGPGVMNVPLTSPEARGNICTPLPGAIGKGMQPMGGSNGYPPPGKHDPVDNSGLAMLTDPLNRFPINPRILKHFQSRMWITFSANAIIATHEIVNLCCSIPGKDAIAHGYKVVCASNDHQKTEAAKAQHDANEVRFHQQIKVAADKMGMNETCAKLNYYKKVYGVGIAIPRVKFKKDAKSPSDSTGNTPYSYADPYNPEMIEPGSYKGFAVVDPIWITYDFNTEEFLDPISPTFQIPTWINTHNRRIHHTWAIRVLNSEVPDILKPSYYYSGLSLTQMLYERVWCADKLANEAPLLAMTKRLLIADGNLEQMIGDPRHTNIFFKAINYFRDNFSIFVKKPSANVTQLDTSLADLAPLTSYQYQQVSAIAQIPVTKLFKNVPTGLQSTGDYEWDDYAQTLMEIQKHDYTPLLRKHFELYIASFYPDRKDLKLDIEWNPIDVPKEKEQVQMASQLAQSTGSLCSQGVILIREARAMLRASSNPMFQYIDPVVPDLLQKLEEQKDPEKAMELQQKMQQMQGGGMPGMPPVDGRMVGAPPVAAPGMLEAGVGAGVAESQQQAQEDAQEAALLKANDQAFKDALKEVLGAERAEAALAAKKKEMFGTPEQQQAPEAPPKEG